MVFNLSLEILKGILTFYNKKITAARIISLTSKYDHITPVLESVHWLPVQYRIDYKVLCLVFKCLHNSAPSYLSALPTQYVPPRTLRSQDQHLLTVPRAKFTSFGMKSFQHVAPV